MSKVTKKANHPIGKTTGNHPVQLGVIREKFDGLRNVAQKLPTGTIKTSMLNHIEELYLATANAFTGGFAGAHSAGV